VTPLSLRRHIFTTVSAKQRQITKNTLNVSIVLAEAYGKPIKIDAQLKFNRNTKPKF